MIDIGLFAVYIRLKVTQNWEKNAIKLSQPEYIKKLLNYYTMLKAKTTKISVQKTALFSSDTPALDLEKAKYLTKVGLIIYAMVKTWIDIAFANSIISWFA